jgi:hypothetical protein
MKTRENATNAALLRAKRFCGEYTSAVDLTIASATRSAQPPNPYPYP